ncbi:MULTISPECIES: nucleotide exchange factor GrpE [Micromonospora]|uniref:nucleotide exchange factor GrpE n=1 Tax=Micromonospora TaxID=1873 RepID=UPI0021A9271D|nr:nucleotide exchange factor GrpE [Micromonospora chalcea]MCT2279580.1 nucleotide exchange factor GrpE [Micromonospora chalcea]
MSTPSDTTPQHDTSPAEGPATTGDGQAGAAAPAPPAPGSGPSAAELEDRWRRAVAEIDNQRKRYERQLAEQARAERARTAAAFLPVLDNLELALQHAEADPAAILAGVTAVHAQALGVLSGLGYQRIGDVGERFDPARHEAAQAVPAAGGVEPGTVAAVLRPGYTDATGTLLRPAVVAVARTND